MFRSIRWTLQLWHAAILLLALIGFGIATYYGSSHAKDVELDAELVGLVHSLMPKLSGPPRPPNPRGDGPPGDRGPADRFPGDRPPFDRPLEDGPPENRRPGERPNERPADRPTDRPSRDIDLPASALERFSNGQDDEPYLIIWRANGDVFKTTTAAIHVPDPGPDATLPQPAIIRRRGIFREAYALGPQRTRVLIGRSTQKQRGELHRLAWLLIATGGGVLAIGLAGGWILSHRVVRPIRAMTATASTISASQLSSRIDTAGIPTELGSLALVLNAMFDRLEASFKRQSQFTADASHELRTPLAVIHSHSELALSRERAPEDYRRTIETCLRASGRMKGLIESLLLLARADAGKLELDCHPLDLGDLTAECAALLQPLADQKSVTIETDLPPTDILGDPVRLTQVINNLLTNAIRYNHDGGQVRLSIAATADHVSLIVADTGIGIDEKDRPHVFDRFFRVDQHRNRESGGSGLGLAICKSIVEAHHGSIEVTADEKNHTIFTVRLPSCPLPPVLPAED